MNYAKLTDKPLTDNVGADDKVFANVDGQLLQVKVQTIRGIEITGVLTAGATSLTLTDDAITTDSTVDIYSSVYSVNPKTVTLNAGSIVMTFKAQTSDVSVKVVLR